MPVAVPAPREPPQLRALREVVDFGVVAGPELRGRKPSDVATAVSALLAIWRAGNADWKLSTVARVGKRHLLFVS